MMIQGLETFHDFGARAGAMKELSNEARSIGSAMVTPRISRCVQHRFPPGSTIAVVAQAKAPFTGPPPFRPCEKPSPKSGRTSALVPRYPGQALFSWVVRLISFS